jgi:hypothetical protein
MMGSLELDIIGIPSWCQYIFYIRSEEKDPPFVSEKKQKKKKTEEKDPKINVNFRCTYQAMPVLYRNNTHTTIDWERVASPCGIVDQSPPPTFFFPNRILTSDLCGLWGCLACN